MGKKKNIFDYVNDVMRTIQEYIVQDQRVLKLLKYTDSTPLSHEDISIEEAWSLMEVREIGNDYKNEIITFKPIIISTIKDVSSMMAVTFEITTAGATKPSFRNIKVYFDVITNHRISELSTGENRCFAIGSALLDLGENIDNKFVGDFKFKYASSLSTPHDYQGVQICFEVSSFLK